MAKLIVIQDGREKTFDLLDELVFVGAGADCTIRVSGAGVQDKQCQLLKVDEIWRLVDLSGGGTRVNGAPTAQRELQNGDVIQVGPVVLNFRGNVRPVAAPEEAAAGAPAAGGTRHHSARVANRARAKARAGARDDGPRVSINPKLQRAADQRETLTRKRLRKGGLNGPQTAALAGGIVILIGLIVWKALGGLASDGTGDLYAQAHAAIARQDYAEARRLIARIPPESSTYPAAQRMLQGLDDRETTRESLDQEQDGTRAFQNQIRQFVIDKIDPATRSKEYDESQPSQIRYLMKRIDHFLATYKGHQYYADVEAYRQKYLPLLPPGPPSYLDIDIEARYEKNLKRYGGVYKTLSDWLANNPGASKEIKERAGRLLDSVVRDAQVEFNYRDADARGNIETGNYQAAYQKYMKCAAQFDGIAADKMPRINGKTPAELAAALQAQLNKTSAR